MLMLYTEDMYKMDKYPYFGYMRGAYTKAEIKEIVEYADIFGIEVIPCIQTLAHLKMALQWDYANDFRDTENILLADEPKTYEFIEEMIKTTRECFKSDRIHIGMDEAFTLGMGQYLNKHGYKERFEIISDHLKKVYEIVKKYDFKPIMWSDMIFNEKMPENVSERIPDGVDMVYWEYWNLDEDFYTENIKRHQAKGFQPVINKELRAGLI
ncbi:MAG: family 20 glycosylhydrolase [Clostridia bacterium]|nr:family 20 glycosylhydrolase [Clostridia bacterium]